MGEPDVAGSECIAQVTQDSDLPEAMPIIFVQVPMPFRGAAQKGQWSAGRRFSIRDDTRGSQQRFGHRGGLNIERPQHARRITSETMIPVNNMCQRIDSQCVGELGSGGDKPPERRPAASVLNSVAQGSLIVMRLQQR